jgi:CxxC motif-containing protein (DUF1111 family)
MVPRFLTACVLLVGLTGAEVPRAVDHEVHSVDAAAGWALFKRAWISQPSSLEAGGGLGPLFDARACNGCHVGGGAGRVGEDALGDGMVLRLGRADAGADAVYGRQLQLQALPGFEAEADAAFHWTPEERHRVAKVDIAALHYGSLGADTHLGLRRAPSLLGIGALESIPEHEILSRPGKPAWLVGADGKRALGRFGWKATAPDLPMQIALAFQRDFGIGTTLLPGAYGECTVAEKACRDAPGPDVEVPDLFRDRIAAYLRTLVTTPPDAKGPGFAQFEKIGCAACHAILKDAAGAPVPAYTDLLLHEMGPGLDDGIADGAARSSEWRTAPLWNVAENLRRGGLLHDGRARSVEEAVSWHGGEASQARAAFNALSPSRRKLVVDFLLGR